MTRLRSHLLAAISLTVILPAAHAEEKPAPQKPNVLFIAVDDLNHWVGYLGRNKQTATPNIDRLAARGVRFTRSYCAAPVCNPSRAALMSGLRPYTSGVYENDDDWRTVIAPELTLTSTFRKAGYHVAGAGKSTTSPIRDVASGMTICQSLLPIRSQLEIRAWAGSSSHHLIVRTKIYANGRS